jgi:hypothetical protein
MKGPQERGLWATYSFTTQKVGFYASQPTINGIEQITTFVYKFFPSLKKQYENLRQTDNDAKSRKQMY